MKTRFSSLVTLKKNNLEKSEQVLQNANNNLKNANQKLENSYNILNNVKPPSHGTMADFIASRSLINSQRADIQHNKEWVEFANNQVLEAKQKLKLDTIEHEKYKYLELEEIKKMLKELKIQEIKDLDEIALLTFSRKNIKI